MNAIAPIVDETACATTTECAKEETPRLDVQASDAQTCVSNSENGTKISSWGGPRPGFGGPQPGSGRPRKQPAKQIHRPIGQRWYAVETRYGTEYRVALDLATGEDRRGWIARPEYETFLPQCKAVRAARGRKSIITAPMIKQIVFVRFDVREDPWAGILSCHDVKRIFSTRPSAPAAIAESDIALLRMASETELGLDPLAMPKRGPETPLTVTEGAFARFAAVCIRCDGIVTTARVEIFGRSCEVTLPWAHFEDRVAA